MVREGRRASPHLRPEVGHADVELLEGVRLDLHLLLLEECQQTCRTADRRRRHHHCRHRGSKRRVRRRAPNLVLAVARPRRRAKPRRAVWRAAALPLQGTTLQ